MTRFRAILFISVLMAFLFVVGVVVIADSPPVVDGAIFGPGDGTASDYPTYTYQYEILDGSDVIGYVYDTGSDHSPSYYVALVLDPKYADNVFDTDPGGMSADPTDYVAEVGWDEAHSFKDLYGSDQAAFTFTCDSDTDMDVEIDLIDCGGGMNPSGVSCSGGWLAPFTDDSGLLESVATSTQWNMNNTQNQTGTPLRWDVLLNGNRTSSDGSDWKSPDLHGDGGATTPSWADVSRFPSELGYVRTAPGSDWYDDTNYWEWPIVYEMKFDVSTCNGTFSVDAAAAGVHASPDKGLQGTTAVTMQKIEAESQPAVQYSGVIGVTLLLLAGGAFAGIMQRRRSQRL